DETLAAEPGGPTPLAGDRLDEACRAAADFADLKSPWLLGHSRAVAELAEAAAWRLGLAARGVGAGRRAALLHDLGRGPGPRRGLGPARAAARRRLGAGPPACLPDRARAVPVGRAGRARGHRGRAPRAAGRLWLSPLCPGGPAGPARPPAGGRRQLSGH